VLHGSRQQVLQQLESGAATLLSLEAPLQQWQRSLAAVERQLSDEVAAAMPFAAGDLQQALGQQQQWLTSAAAHTANLLEVAQAVLQLEASRTADSASGTAAAAAVAGAGQQTGGAQPADRYSAEQREGWQRYAALLQQMQQLHGAYTAAERDVAAAAGELQQLALRRQEATAIAQSAEEAGSTAATAFAASALPLVKATQQLPTAMAQLLPRLSGASQWADQLAQSQRWAAELAAAAADDDGSGVGQGAAAAAEQLAAAAACARQLPAAVQQLQAALLPVRNRLLAGGRGEAAAQQQAADVVDALSAAVTELQPQVGRLSERFVCATA
jgi:chromosome segregation ATPase